MRELKGELLALMLAMHERIQSLEILQEQQNSAIQVCHRQHDTNYLVSRSTCALVTERCEQQFASA